MEQRIQTLEDLSMESPFWSAVSLAQYVMTGSRVSCSLAIFRKCWMDFRVGGQGARLSDILPCCCSCGLWVELRSIFLLSATFLLLSGLV